VLACGHSKLNIFMGNFKKDRKSSMHKATCSECGNSCEVPFKPTGSKPVFCSDCFEKQHDSKPRRFDGRKPRHSDRGEKRMFKATCSECGDSCEVPFKPTGSKPVFCSDCFEASGGGKGGSGSSNKQFEILNDKLDEILKVLKPTVVKDVPIKKKKAAKKETKEEKKTVKKTATKKTVKKAAPKKKADTTKKATTKKKSATKKKTTTKKKK